MLTISVLRLDDGQARHAGRAARQPDRPPEPRQPGRGRRPRPRRRRRSTSTSSRSPRATPTSSRSLVRSVRAELNSVAPGYQLTFDTTGYIGNYPIEDATAPGGADAIFIMGYDYRTAGARLRRLDLAR